MDLEELGVGASASRLSCVGNIQRSVSILNLIHQVAPAVHPCYFDCTVQRDTLKETVMDWHGV